MTKIVKGEVMSLIPDDVLHRRLTLAAGDRRIEVLTALIDDSDTAMGARAFADFRIDDEIRGAGIFGTGSESSVMQYVGVIPPELASELYPERLRNLVFSILKDAGRQRRSSLWVNFSDNQLWRHMPATFQDYLGIMQGIWRYAEFVSGVLPESNAHVDEIVIGCGAMTYGYVNSALQTPRCAVQLQTIFATGLVR